jgi:hypothetical protein
MGCQDPLALRRQQFKAALNHTDAKKGRELATNAIRKAKKDEIVTAKRRQGMAAVIPGMGGTVGVPHIPEEAITPTKNLDPVVKSKVGSMLGARFGGGWAWQRRWPTTLGRRRVGRRVLGPPLLPACVCDYVGVRGVSGV